MWACVWWFARGGVSVLFYDRSMQCDSWLCLPAVATLVRACNVPLEARHMLMRSTISWPRRMRRRGRLGMRGWLGFESIGETVDSGLSANHCFGGRPDCSSNLCITSPAQRFNKMVGLYKGSPFFPWIHQITSNRTRDGPFYQRLSVNIKTTRPRIIRNINKKQKIGPQLKEGDKVYLLIKNLKKKH